jgi:predicted transglutaminase-like cysteine proteinase
MMETMRTHLGETLLMTLAVGLALIARSESGLASDASATIRNKFDAPPVTRAHVGSGNAIATKTTAWSTTEEPFGRHSLQVGNGPLAVTWQSIKARMRADMTSVDLCGVKELACTSASRNLRRIVEEARTHEGLARIGYINRAINLAIKPTSTPYWPSALETLSSGIGDCKGYSVAKYLALREAGFTDRDVKLVIIHDTAAHQDHAILTVQFEGSWYVLDNRWLALVHDVELRHADPLYILDESGVRRFDHWQAVLRPIRSNADI